MLVVLLLGVALGRVVVLALILFLDEDRVGHEALSYGQEQVVQLATLMLDLLIGFDLLLVGMSGIFGVVGGDVLGEISSDVLCEVGGDVLAVVDSSRAVLLSLKKLSAVNLVGGILFNGNSLSMVHLFGLVGDNSGILFCSRILGCVSSDVLLNESLLLDLWRSLGLEKIFSSTDSLVVLLLDFDGLFDYISDLFLLGLYLSLLNSFDERLGAAKVKFVGILGWLKRLFRHDLLVTGDLLDSDILQSSLALRVTLVGVIDFSILSRVLLLLLRWLYFLLLSLGKLLLLNDLIDNIFLVDFLTVLKNIHRLLQGLSILNLIGLFLDLLLDHGLDL